jgi:hypothetical protein
VAELHRDQCRLLPREGGLSNDILGRPFRPRFAGPAAAFTLAVIAAPLVRSRQPSDHGWWLVGYLALVGGLSQLMLGAGQFALGALSVGPRVLAGELVFWNLGAMLVPVGVFAGAPGVVAVGSVVLLSALARQPPACPHADALAITASGSTPTGRSRSSLPEASPSAAVWPTRCHGSGKNS